MNIIYWFYNDVFFLWYPLLGNNLATTGYYMISLVLNIKYILKFKPYK